MHKFNEKGYRLKMPTVNEGALNCLGFLGFAIGITGFIFTVIGIGKQVRSSGAEPDDFYSLGKSCLITNSSYDLYSEQYNKGKVCNEEWVYSFQVIGTLRLTYTSEPFKHTPCHRICEKCSDSSILGENYLYGETIDIGSSVVDCWVSNHSSAAFIPFWKCDNPVCYKLSNPIKELEDVRSSIRTNYAVGLPLLVMGLLSLIIFCYCFRTSYHNDWRSIIEKDRKEREKQRRKERKKLSTPV